MTVADDFKSFCGTLSVTNRSTIGDRYGLITRRLNLEFWNSASKTLHSFYTGSYGRGTAIGGTSDVDTIPTKNTMGTPVTANQRCYRKCALQ